MATKLDKDLIRESTEMIDKREIVITLAADQTIKMKLKGLKTGEVSIDIIQLYKQLTGLLNESEDDAGDEDNTPANNKASLIISHDEEDEEKPQRGKVLIDLNDLRSANAISTLDIPTLAKFDGLIVEFIKSQKELVESKKALEKKVPVKKKKK